MKKIIYLLLLSAFTSMASAQTKIQLTIGENTKTATLVDNEAAKTLLSLLEEGPISINMSDYGGFEKVGALPQALPTSNSQITTEPGDIMLYQGDNMVIFYGSNSWSYTRLGKIDGANAEEVRQFLGSGNIQLQISLHPSAGINVDLSDKIEKDNVCDLNGNVIKTRPLSPGLYIIDGKKTLISH